MVLSKTVQGDLKRRGRQTSGCWIRLCYVSFGVGKKCGGEEDEDIWTHHAKEYHTHVDTGKVEDKR